MPLLINGFMSNCTCKGLPIMEFMGFRDVDAPVGAVETLKPAQKGNNAKDVRTVQEMLNLVPTAEGGQQGAEGVKGLVEDGLIGKFTRAAIVAFQKKQFPDKKPDGVVEKSKRTVYRLNVLAYRSVDSDLQAKGRAHVAQASNYIQQALTLATAMQMQLSLPNPLFKNEKAERLLNYHFHLDKSSDKVRDLDSICRTLVIMRTATAYLPLGPNRKPAFGFIDTMPTGYQKDPPYAFTFGGGYQYLMGQNLTQLLKQLGIKNTGEIAGDLRVDQIYLTRRVLNATPGIITYAIIHELAHFVGGVAGDIDHITDRAYLHRQKANYEKLSTYEAMTNADSFSQFCWETVKGTTFTP